jgi:hypothetical protein
MSDTDQVTITVKSKEELPDGDNEDDGRTDVFRSYTPEDKFGPAGYDTPDTPEGSEVRYIPDSQTMDYRIEFWNKEDAPVPTQDAVIEDTLDPNIFDFSTFEFTRIGFLQWDMPLPGGQAIDTRIDCRPEMNIAVEVTATFDPDTSKIKWWFHCIDPLTGDWPEDPMAGFLPPFNPETGFEIGWVEFKVKPKADRVSGTQILNQAFVEFDFAGDINDHPAPKEGPWINTIDAGVPTSEVDDLPAEVPPEFAVSWSGDDDAGGSGIVNYDIYVSDNGGPFEVWLDNTALTEETFTGESGHTYAFYSIARDGVGHVEDAPDEPDAVVVCSLGTTIVSISIYTGWNLISAPLNLTSWKLGQESVVGDPLNITPENSLTSIYRYNTTSELFEKWTHYADWGWAPATGSESFTELEPGRGYWVMAENDCTLTFTGTAPSDLDVPLDTDWNCIGWYSTSAALLGEEAIVGDPLNVTPENSLTSIYRYNTTSELFEKCTHYDDWGWAPATGSESFTELEPGRGYWVMAENDCVWGHEV